MRASEVIDLMGGVAVGQWGLVTTGQAVAAGAPAVDVARAAERGLLRRVRHGVYAMHGGATGDHLEEIRAEWLATDPKRTAHERRNDPDPVVVSDESAATVYGIGDLPAGGVHLTASRRLRPSAATAVVPHQRLLHPREVTWVDGLPVTTVRRTLEDLSDRWEPQHIRDAVTDAVTRGLMPAREIANSRDLLGVVPDLAPPPTHAGLKQRLKNAQPNDPGGALNEFFRMQFLGRLSDYDGWVLKGGTGLLCRLNDARSTKDLDLFRDGSEGAQESARLLAQQMDGATVGRYIFDVGAAIASEQGHLEIARLPVRVNDGSVSVGIFTIDVAGAVMLNDQPEWHLVRTATPIPGYPHTIGVALYPVENQLADKLCAMYQSYGHGSRSTRYHDLYDAALIVDQLTFDPDTLHAALRTQYERRQMRPIGVDMAEPAPGWAEAYNRTVPKLAGSRPPFTDFATARAAVRAAVAPVLATASQEHA